MGIPILPRGDEGLTKYCSWGAWYQDGTVRVPHVRKIATNGRRFAKTAKFECGDTAELVRQFVEEYQVKVGHTYLLDTALGAYEAWGSNNNGDAFREADLMIDSDDHGYRSFQKHAHVFRHHRNSDPTTSIGKVVLAAFNKDMKRVEVIEELDNFKAADLLQKWENEGSLATSMGCRVAFDVCSICGNKAPTASKYCEHAKYAMNRVHEDGRKICVFNPNPKFFDQSHVIIPAEKIAGTMMKVAHERDVETPEVVPSVVAGAMRNVIEIESEPVVKTAGQHLDPDIEAFAASEPTLPVEVLDALAEHPLHKVASTLTYLGIVPKPEEWQYLVLSHQGHRKEAAAFHADNICFDPLSAEVPELTDDDRDFIDESYADPVIARKLADWVPERSALPQFLGPRLVSEKTAAEAEKPEKKPLPSIPQTAAALGVSYGLMRAIQAENAGSIFGISKAVGVPQVVTALLIAAGFAAALRGGAKIMEGGTTKKASVASFLDEDLIAAMDGPWQKTAKGTLQWIADTPDPIKGVVVPFGAGYMTSAYYRAKQMQGQPTTSFQNVVAEHPLATGIGATGAVALARRALRR